MITNKNVNKKIKLTHKEFIITIITLIILTVLAVFVINRTSIISKIKQAIQKEKKPLFAYEIYNNQDENNIKVLVTVNSEDGIEYIIMPNETRIDCYEKTSKAIDYVAAKNSEGTFKIKEKGKDEKAETIKLDDQTLYSNGIALDETDQSGYKELTTKSNLNTLKDRFTTCSYKIGENGTWTSPSTINSEDKIYKTSALDYDIIQNDLLNEDNTVTIYTKLSDSIGNAVISKSRYSVDTTQNENAVQAESLLKAVEEYDKGNGKYTVTVSDQTYNLKMYTVNGNLTIGANTAIGNNKDVATGEETDKMAKNMVVLKVNGDLTIDENSTLTTFSKEYGGPKGLMIYCTGTITNNGDISQSGKGAHAKGQNVYLLRRTDGSYDYVPAEGGAGGEGYDVSSPILLGNKGKDGSGKQTGGAGAGNGGAGIVPGIRVRVIGHADGGKGAAGTSYSGGIGGTDGRVATWQNSRGWNYTSYPGSDGTPNGGSGAGGLLTIYGNNIVNSSTGKITSNGQDVGSGGGSINIFYENNYKNENVIEANGGIPKGGNGTVTITNLGDKTPPEAFEIETADIKSKEFTIKGETTDKDSGIRNYTIVVEYVADTGDTTTTKKIENITEMPYTVTDLQPATTYKVYVIAYDNSRNATESNKITVTTKDPEITYETVAVNTTNNVTTSAAAYSITKGTTLYINIVAKLEGQACTVTLKEDSTKTAPYAVTKNGRYTFTVKGTYNGKTITGEKEVIVTQFNEPQFVKYDAGTWTQEEINALGNLYNENLSREQSSSLNQTFGGFKVGDSRNDSVQCRYGTVAYSGWEILTSEVKNGKTYVTKILHAGAPENYVHYRTDGYHASRSEWILSGGTRGESVSGKSPRKWDMYIDNSQRSLISEVHAMTYDEAVAITGNTNDTDDARRNTGAYYWLASASNNFDLCSVSNRGGLDSFDYRCWGVRPVVSLQSGVYISGGSGTESDPYILAKE